MSQSLPFCPLLPGEISGISCIHSAAITTVSRMSHPITVNRGFASLGLSPCPPARAREREEPSCDTVPSGPSICAEVGGSATPHTAQFCPKPDPSLSPVRDGCHVALTAFCEGSDPESSRRKVAPWGHQRGLNEHA